MLSPAYDLLNINLLNPKGPEELGLTINAKKSKIKLAGFKALTVNLQIKEKVYNYSFALFISRNAEVMELIERSFLEKKIEKSLQINLAQKTRNIWLREQT